ncbi:MAG: hypothetical protein K6A72_03235 [Lachnospiraceae bacterium]|nr:hypothetical protein [Lachnospiraceae bacterium]
MDIGNLSNLTNYTSSLAAASSAQKKAESANSAQTDEEMLSACKEFESYLWEQVLKSMKSASEVFNTEEDDQKVSYFKETAMADIAKQITDQNLGSNSLAMQMYEQMKRNQGITADELEARLAGEGSAADDAPTDDALVAAASAMVKDETE